MGFNPQLHKNQKKEGENNHQRNKIHQKLREGAGHQWLTPVSLGTWEAESGESRFKASLVK
jgi:hypothetical protein